MAGERMASRTRRKLLHNILRQDLAFFDATAPAHLVKVLQVLLYMCLHTATYVPSYYCVCALILLCMCLHTSIYVPLRQHTSSKSFRYYYMCPHTATYVPSYYCVCAFILLYMSHCASIHIYIHIYIYIYIYIYVLYIYKCRNMSTRNT
jgi:hypothetical protein